MDLFGEFARFVEIGLGGFPPHQIGIRREGKAAGDCVFDAHMFALLQTEEAFGRALTGQEPLVPYIHVGRDHLRRMGIGCALPTLFHAHDISGETCGVEGADELLCRQQHLAAEMAALLFRCQLIFEMHAGGARFDHRLHQFEGVERAAEAGFRIGNDRREPMCVVAAFHCVDLIGALQRLVDLADHLGGR